jgi:transposase InsO family protein
LKTELLYGNKLISKKQMKQKIFIYIEVWYNRKRRHTALNYSIIEEFTNHINYKKVAELYVQFLFAYPVQQY